MGASFPQTKITPRRRSSPLCQDGPERCKELLEGIPDFDQLFEGSRKTYDEVRAMLDEFLLGETKAEEGSTETASSGDNGSNNSVDQAFADLLGG